MLPIINRCDNAFSAARAAIELSPAFQSRESGYIVVSVAERQLKLTGKLNRRSATEVGCAHIIPALKSRARLTWSLRDREDSCRIYLSKTVSLSDLDLGPLIAQPRPRVNQRNPFIMSMNDHRVEIDLRDSWRGLGQRAKREQQSF